MSEAPAPAKTLAVQLKTNTRQTSRVQACKLGIIFRGSSPSDFPSFVFPPSSLLPPLSLPLLSV